MKSNKQFFNNKFQEKRYLINKLSINRIKIDKRNANTKLKNNFLKFYLKEFQTAIYFLTQTMTSLCYKKIKINYLRTNQMNVFLLIISLVK